MNTLFAVSAISCGIIAILTWISSRKDLVLIDLAHRLGYGAKLSPAEARLLIEACDEIIEKENPQSGVYRNAVEIKLLLEYPERGDPQEAK